jgi:hypothetical protein
LLLVSTLVTLFALNGITVAALAWRYSRGQGWRQRRLRQIVGDPLSVRGTWTEGPDDEGYFRMFVEYLDGRRALLADHFEVASTRLLLRGAGFEVLHGGFAEGLSSAGPASPEKWSENAPEVLAHRSSSLYRSDAASNLGGLVTPDPNPVMCRD